MASAAPHRLSGSGDPRRAQHGHERGDWAGGGGRDPPGPGRDAGRGPPPHDRRGPGRLQHARPRLAPRYHRRMRRYRFIVARDNEGLYEHLVRSLAGEEEIEVLLDRRVERRRGGGSAPGREGQVERRLQARVDEGLRTFGWAFVKIDRI